MPRFNNITDEILGNVLAEALKPATPETVGGAFTFDRFLQNVGDFLRNETVQKGMGMIPDPGPVDPSDFIHPIGAVKQAGKLALTAGKAAKKGTQAAKKASKVTKAARTGGRGVTKRSPKGTKFQGEIIPQGTPPASMKHPELGPFGMINKKTGKPVMTFEELDEVIGMADKGINRDLKKATKKLEKLERQQTPIEQVKPLPQPQGPPIAEPVLAPKVGQAKRGKARKPKNIADEALAIDYSFDSTPFPPEKAIEHTPYNVRKIADEIFDGAYQNELDTLVDAGRADDAIDLGGGRMGSYVDGAAGNYGLGDNPAMMADVEKVATELARRQGYVKDAPKPKPKARKPKKAAAAPEFDEFTMKAAGELKDDLAEAGGDLSMIDFEYYAEKYPGLDVDKLIKKGEKKGLWSIEGRDIKGVAPEGDILEDTMANLRMPTEVETRQIQFEIAKRNQNATQADINTITQNVQEVLASGDPDKRLQLATELRRSHLSNHAEAFAADVVAGGALSNYDADGLAQALRSFEEYKYMSPEEISNIVSVHESAKKLAWNRHLTGEFERLAQAGVLGPDELARQMEKVKMDVSKIVQTTGDQEALLRGISGDQRLADLITDSVKSYSHVNELTGEVAAQAPLLERTASKLEAAMPKLKKSELIVPETVAGAEIIRFTGKKAYDELFGDQEE
jgi:hypothetical protein